MERYCSLICCLNVIRYYPVHELFSMLQCNRTKIYSFHPKIRLFLCVHNWVLLYTNENAKGCALPSRSSCYRFAFFVFPLTGVLCKLNKIIVKVQNQYQLIKRHFEGRLEGFFRVSLGCLKIMWFIKYQITKNYSLARKNIKLPKNITTHLTSFHSIKQFLIILSTSFF